MGEAVTVKLCRCGCCAPVPARKPGEKGPERVFADALCAVRFHSRRRYERVAAEAARRGTSLEEEYRRRSRVARKCSACGRRRVPDARRRSVCEQCARKAAP